MADISKYTDEIQNAVYGEEVRSSIINALNKVNDDNNSYADLKEEVIAAKDDVTAKLAAAQTSINNLTSATNTANTAKSNLTTATSTADSKLKELQAETFNSTEILNGVEDIKAYLGISGDDVAGLEVDYENKTCTRLAGAAGLSAGSDFDSFQMYGGRKKCNVADDGTINAWYGDDGYVEDGSNGQVMVYQPKFYYKVVPVKLEKQSTGIGYHGRKMRYYVSDTPKPGFTVHPAFYDANGDEIDYILESAYEGSIYDASASAYILDDSQVMDASADKFCSIAGARPATGSSQDLTRPKIEQMAQNRGTEWHGDLIKVESADQLLMIIEMGSMNLQTAIANGVVYLPWTTGSDTTSSYAAKTGSTASIGNGTGQAASTVAYPGNVETTYTANGCTSVIWRGKENPWSNIWKLVYGINIWGNGNMGGGQPYICNDFNFAESKNSGNYEVAGFTVTNANGYISAMGYSTVCDWLFMASECLGNSSLPVGDYTYVTSNLNGYRIALLGGCWNGSTNAGGFSWNLYSGVSYRFRYVGGRLVYVPVKDSTAYKAAITSWEEQIAA